MLLEVLSAHYIQDYKIFLKFNDGYEGQVDLKGVLVRERRNIFKPLRELEYFEFFSIKFNTIC